MTYIAYENRYQDMLFRRVGLSGIKLPLISLGMWHHFGDETAHEQKVNLLTKAFDMGITHFDLANNYGPPPGSAESAFGKVLSKELASYRDEIIVSSKAGYMMWPGPYGEWGSRKYLVSSCDQSLKRTGLDYFDIFYSHRFDPETPLEETLGALNTAVQQGKALYVGISSYSTQQTKEAVEICRSNGWERLLIHQPNYSLFNRWIEDRLAAACEENGMGMIAFCPLYQGLLTDKYLSEIPDGSRAVNSPGTLRPEELRDEVLEVVSGLNTVALNRGQSLAQMALAWILRLPQITSVLCGASRPEQILENCAALENLHFSDEEIREIDDLTNTVELPASLWAKENDS